MESQRNLKKTENMKFGVLTGKPDNLFIFLTDQITKHRIYLWKNYLVWLSSEHSKNRYLLVRSQKSSYFESFGPTWVHMLSDEIFISWNVSRLLTALIIQKDVSGALWSVSTYVLTLCTDTQSVTCDNKLTPVWSHLLKLWDFWLDKWSELEWLLNVCIQE